MRKKLKIGNDGFSLVELVIVVAIMVIIGGAAVTGLGLLTSRPVDECAKKIQIALEGNRNTTMGKFSSKLVFTEDANGVWLEEYINGNSEGKIQIGQSGVTVEYIIQANGVGPATTNDFKTTPLEVSFNRANGSLNPLVEGGNNYVTSFIVSRGDIKTLTVTIDRLTGRVEVQ